VKIQNKIDAYISAWAIGLKINQALINFLCKREDTALV
jgi:hypothetical protein